MRTEEAAKLINDTFRGMRYRLHTDGLLDLIVGRMAPLLAGCVNDENEACAKIMEGYLAGDLSDVADLIRKRVA